MPNRAELELRAASANVVAANYPNDSRFEQAIIFAEKARVASIASTTLLPSATSVQGVNGGANV